MCVTMGLDEMFLLLLMMMLLVRKRKFSNFFLLIFFSFLTIFFSLQLALIDYKWYVEMRFVRNLLLEFHSALHFLHALSLIIITHSDTNYRIFSLTSQIRNTSIAFLIFFGSFTAAMTLRQFCLLFCSYIIIYF